MHLGAGAIDPFVHMVEEDSEYPAAYQIGRGKSTNVSPPYDTNQVLDPAYCWNNQKLPTEGSANVVDGRDFFSNTVKPGYAPFTYPHPMRATAPAAPTALKVAPN